ncbi:hypothetical protein [Endozoicomonas acroporae]|uniref:hypothetical protein n=1 Tax=Endozoicomonas acroporae TaxID=1701104 RepID=UPI003D79103F
METVFLLLYLAAYWFLKISGTIGFNQEWPVSIETYSLLLMASLSIFFAVARVYVGNKQFKVSSRDPVPGFKKRVFSDLGYLFFGFVVLMTILRSDKNYFDTGVRELGLSMFVYWIIAFSFGFLRESRFYNKWLI